jgi:hypothetical protein
MAEKAASRHRRRGEWRKWRSSENGGASIN